MRVIDAHSHWLPKEIIANAHFFSKVWGDNEAHLAAMDAAGIDAAVLSYPTSDAHLRLGSISLVVEAYNEAVSAVIRRYPGRFIGAAILPLDSPSEMADEVRRASEEFGFKAVSLATSYNGKYLDDPLFLPVYKEAEKRKMPIFIHPQIVNPIGFERVQDPLLTPVIEYVFDTTMCVGRLLMSGLLSEYAGLPFIFSSFAGVIPHLEHRFDTTYEMLRSLKFVRELEAAPSRLLKNIYVDTGGDTKRTNFLAALEFCGPEHMLWGSDWTAKKDISVSIQAVRSLEIRDQEKEAILGGNLERLLS